MSAAAATIAQTATRPLCDRSLEVDDRLSVGGRHAPARQQAGQGVARRQEAERAG
jgi:hypothetical protein